MNKINGNTQGIRRSTLEAMLSIYDIKATDFLSEELALALASYTEKLKKEVAVYIARDGSVKDVRIGETTNVHLNEMRLVRNIDRLSGVRCIHTHPSGNSALSEADISALKSMKFDAMCALGVVDGLPSTLSAAFVDADEGVKIYGPLAFNQIDGQALMEMIEESDARLIASTQKTLEHERERAILVGVTQLQGEEATLDELEELARTAGADVMGRVAQKRNVPDTAYYIGKGKAEEILKQGNAQEADIFIFDDELSAVQIRNLEALLGARVIDRTALILDIFAARAQSREGKLQVELAQLKYRLPRLTGFGHSLSRQGGGIGTRGPGEKKLESDRRRIRRQLYELECELEEVRKQRGVRRARREKNAVPVVALVGYTNSGKSTLLNCLSGSNVNAEDMLFATLDPVTREVELPGGSSALFTDTVGFIDKLPHDLVEAFKSTLEEVALADVIVHVVDSSRQDYTDQMQVVNDVLDSLGAGGKPTLVAYNKRDKHALAAVKPSASSVCISAKFGQGIEALLELIQKTLESAKSRVTLEIPYARGDVIAYVKQNARVDKEDYEQEGAVLEVIADDATLGTVRKMLEALE